MQFCLAVAAVDGPPGLRHFSHSWIENSSVRALLPRIKLVERQGFTDTSNDAVPASVEIRLKDGRYGERTTTVPRGDPRRPLDDAERMSKFIDCAESVLGDETEACWHSLQVFDNS